MSVLFYRQREPCRVSLTKRVCRRPSLREFVIFNVHNGESISGCFNVRSVAPLGYSFILSFWRYWNSCPSDKQHYSMLHVWWSVFVGINLLSNLLIKYINYKFANLKVCKCKILATWKFGNLKIWKLAIITVDQHTCKALYLNLKIAVAATCNYLLLVPFSPFARPREKEKVRDRRLRWIFSQTSTSERR